MRAAQREVLRLGVDQADRDQPSAMVVVVVVRDDDKMCQEVRDRVKHQATQGPQSPSAHRTTAPSTKVNSSSLGGGRRRSVMGASEGDLHPTVPSRSPMQTSTTSSISPAELFLVRPRP